MAVFPFVNSDSIECVVYTLSVNRYVMATIMHRCIVSNTSLPCSLFRYFLRVVLHYNNANRVKAYALKHSLPRLYWNSVVKLPSPSSTECLDFYILTYATVGSDPPGV